VREFGQVVPLLDSPQCFIRCIVFEKRSWKHCNFSYIVESWTIYDHDISINGKFLVEHDGRKIWWRNLNETIHVLKVTTGLVFHPYHARDQSLEKSGRIFSRHFLLAGIIFLRLFSTEFNSHRHYQIPRKADRLTCYYKYRTTGTKLEGILTMLASLIWTIMRLLVVNTRPAIGDTRGLCTL
jgi:hypothetical protein